MDESDDFGFSNIKAFQKIAKMRLFSLQITSMVLQMMISPLHKLRKPNIMGFLSGCCEGPRDVVPTVPTTKMQ